MFENVFNGKGERPKNVESGQNRIYLDYASVTPTDDRVLSCVTDCLRQFPANPGSLYAEGVKAGKKLEEAKASVAQNLEVHSDEIYFTSGGTESNNLVILGALNAYEQGKKNKKAIPHIVSLEIEHPSVKETLAALVKEKKCKVTYVSVDRSGVVDPKNIKKALRPETVLVSVMYANNEIGTIQPIHEIAKAIRAFKKEKKEDGGGLGYPYFHTDACQAAAYETLRVPNLGIDLLTLDGSKIYGPRGTGMLFVRRGASITPLFYGGSQESGLRPGTENVAGAAGFALALDICQKEKVKEKKKESEPERIAKLRDQLLASIIKAVPKVIVNGSLENRLPNNINICLSNIDAEFAVLKLDVAGVCVSSVTSCRSRNEDSSSYVIEALSSADAGSKAIETKTATVKKAHIADNPCSKSSLRITLGRYTGKKEVQEASKAIIKVLTAML